MFILGSLRCKLLLSSTGVDGCVCVCVRACVYVCVFAFFILKSAVTSLVLLLLRIRLFSVKISS